MTYWLMYGAKVAALLGIAWLFYRWVLAHQPLGRFKRGYLLLALVLAHLIPLLPVRQVYVPLTATVGLPLTPQPPVEVAAPTPAVPPERAAASFDVAYLFFLVYAIGVGISGWRFVRSIRGVLLRARLGLRRRYQRAWLIELPGEVAPHTFCRWIFYGVDNPPAPSILAHEYAHVAEWHTLDRLFVALLRIVCWFNPLLPLYERAIVFNHEYLADRAVLRRGFSLRNYQYGLLSALSRRSTHPRLASGADFHFTKKRLQMMLLPAISPARTTILWSLTIALGLGMLWSFGRTTVVPVDTVSPLSSAPQIGLSLATAKNTVSLPPVFTIRERPLRRPTADQFFAWSNAEVYGVWIDGKRIENSELANYDPTDFSFHNVSRLPPNAKHDGRLSYEVNLTTNATFERNRYVPSWQSSSCRWEPTPAKDDC